MKIYLRTKRSKIKEQGQRAKKVQSPYGSNCFTEAGSESASFIMINEADLKDLKDPSILARFTNFIPDFLLLRITHEIRTDKEEREKRKLDELHSHSSEPTMDAKRRCMDGSKAAERVIGSQRDIEFPISFLQLMLMSLFFTFLP